MANNAWWSLTACVAWILSRDSSAVDALNKPLPAVDKLAAHIRLSRLNNRPIKNARRELTDGVAKEKLMARGYNTVTKRRECIPSDYTLASPYEDGSDRVGQYRDVVVARTQMMKFCRGEERTLTHKDVANWIAARIKAGQLRGLKPMWEDCMRELRGQISRQRFAELRKTRMGIVQIDAPRPGRPPGR